MPSSTDEPPASQGLDWHDIRAAIAALGPPVSLDTSEKAPLYLIYSPRGLPLRISHDVYRLLALDDGREDAAVLAERLERLYGVTVEALAVAQRQVYDRIASVDDKFEGNFGRVRFKVTFIPAVWVGRLARPLERLFTPRLFTPVMSVLAVAGIALLLERGLSGGIHRMQSSDFSTGFVLYVLSLIVHEFGHAAACARFGARPAEIGFGIYLIYPVFFANITDAWRLKRWQRCIVDFGGIYLQGLVAAGFLMAFSLTQADYFRVAGLLAFGTCLASLNPFLKFDGYWAMSDALGITNLHAQIPRILRWIRSLILREPVEPLPWPPVARAVVIGYVLLCSAAFFVFAVRILPRVFQHVVLTYPKRAIGFVTAIPAQLAAGDVWAAPMTVWHLLVATFFVYGPVLMVWRLIASIRLAAQTAIEQLLKRLKRPPASESGNVGTLDDAAAATDPAALSPAK